MARKKPKPLTKAELRIMDVLWEHRRATVGEVADALPKPLAYTTVLTMLRILEQKGVVGRDVDGRAHVYFPRIEQQDAARSAIGDVVKAFFENSKTALALRLMAEERPSKEELESLKAMIARYEEGAK